MIYDDLRNIVVKTFGVADTIADSLLKIASDINFAFLYGSIPAKTDTDRSDIN